ncbi:hypothetical protein LSH36_586g00002 [Paralvinella palmiformis]|uniref:Uncharacterized protein n=1 Tax=Paralvinella palmiformis TaxID=53620 RepID=A0AAD9MV94_9ANNE|nr:hypothetical protein LSH36_586g00002 [Paralvinella palmiformis]
MSRRDKRHLTVMVVLDGNTVLVTQVQHGDDLFTWRCAHCSIPNIHDESQLIDPDAENTRLPTEISPSRYLRDIGINASLVLTPHQHVIDISTLNITSITGCTYHWAQGIVKLFLRKAHDEGSDPHIYLLQYRNATIAVDELEISLRQSPSCLRERSVSAVYQDRVMYKTNITTRSRTWERRMNVGDHERAEKQKFQS